MERPDPQPDAERADIAVRSAGPQLWSDNHHIHHTGETCHDAADHASDAVHQENDGATAQDQGNPAPLRQGPGPYFPGDHASLQRGGCQSGGLSGAYGHTVSYLDRAISVYHPSVAFHPGEAGRSFLSPVYMVAFCKYRRTDSSQ